MWFQAYTDNIKAKRGKGGDEFRKLAEKTFVQNDYIKAGVKDR